MKRGACRASAIALVGFVASLSSAAPTDFDPAFNDGAAVQISEGIVSAATFPDGGVVVQTLGRVLRIDTAGRLDASFEPVTPVAGAGFGAMGVSPSGLIGTLQTDYTRWPFVDAYIARYLSNGTLDATFGAAEAVKFTTYFRGGPGGRLLLDAAGRAYFLAGTSHLSHISQHVRRIGPTASESVVLDSVSGLGLDVRLYNDMSFAPDGALLVARTSMGSELAVSRITESGPDLSFGIGGLARASVPGDARASYAIQGPDGTVLVAGTAFREGSPQVVIARFLANGALDTSFADGGVVVVDGARSGEGLYSPLIALQTDGRIVMATTVYEEPRSGRPFPRILVARLTPDGKPDDRFAPAGFTTYWWQHGTELVYLDVRLDGRILLGGSVYASIPTGSAVSRSAVVFRLQGGDDTVARPWRERKAVEFFHAGYGHYFMTADAEERSGPTQLDSFPGLLSG